MISTHFRILAIIGSLALLVFILELVRRRRLKEEYSVLWVATAIVLLVLAVSGALLHWLTSAIGAVAESSTLYFFGLLFVIFLLLHFSVRVSMLERRLTALVQEIALITARHPPRPRHPEELGASVGLLDQEEHQSAAHQDDVVQA